MSTQSPPRKFAIPTGLFGQYGSEYRLGGGGDNSSSVERMKQAHIRGSWVLRQGLAELIDAESQASVSPKESKAVTRLYGACVLVSAAQLYGVNSSFGYKTVDLPWIAVAKSVRDDRKKLITRAIDDVNQANGALHNMLSVRGLSGRNLENSRHFAAQRLGSCSVNLAGADALGYIQGWEAGLPDAGRTDHDQSLSVVQQYRIQSMVKTSANRNRRNAVNLRDWVRETPSLASLADQLSFTSKFASQKFGSFYEVHSRLVDRAQMIGLVEEEVAA